MGQPPRAVQPNMVRRSPDGRRLTATAPHVFGTVFDVLDSSSALTRKSARNAGLLSDCVGVVGRLSDGSALCRTSSGSFQVRDARSGQAVGDPIGVVGPRGGTVAEGMLVSADGGEFIVSVHVPNDPYGSADLSPDFRAVPTTSDGETVHVSHDFLHLGTVFLEWLRAVGGRLAGGFGRTRGRPCRSVGAATRVGGARGVCHRLLGGL
ncbi:hypothetical protein ACWGI0_30570 [Streptomyces sp. NPDC054802]